ncbi:MAG: hypothetical protein EHM85_06110 [Desulfobacteraceae bacterium]|nr:MAG: hypothetical protein EHM85_06110 [Desulfobacteraceae bacterium]
MIVIPKEKPVIENLNSYYIDIRKLIEHYQGQLGAGGIHFKSPAAEGVIYFDKDELLGGVFKDRERNIHGKEVLDTIIEVSSQYNFVISIYEIAHNKVYFWANIPDAKKIYKNLSTEFTDLDGLIKKMVSEKLTGYIEVIINKGGEGGLVFFSDGEIIGGSYSWGRGEVNSLKENRDLLVAKTKDTGGVFHVSRIEASKRSVDGEKNRVEQKNAVDIIIVLEELLQIVESEASKKKNIERDFNSILKKKFVEKADKYVFLDPFADEFRYSSGKITFTGEATFEELLRGVAESVKEIAEESGFLSMLNDSLSQWSQKYAGELDRTGIKF